jgi:hypothetical protein
MPRPHLTPGKDPVPIVQEAGCASGPVWTGEENLAPTGIRSPARPTRRQSLYRLRYPANIWLLLKGYKLFFLVTVCNYLTTENDSGFPGTQWTPDSVAMLRISLLLIRWLCIAQSSDTLSSCDQWLHADLTVPCGIIFSVKSFSAYSLTF